MDDDERVAEPTLWAIVTPAQWLGLMAVPRFAAEVDLAPEDAQRVIGPKPLGRVYVDRDLDGTPQRFWLLFFEAHPSTEEALNLIAQHFGGVYGGGFRRTEFVWRSDR